MAIALRGSLRDFGISDVFQLIGQQGKTGVLEVDDHGRRLHVHFVDGTVTTAVGVGPYEYAALGDMLTRVGALTPDQLVAIESQYEKGDGDFFRLLIREGDLSAQEIEEIEDLVTGETLFSLLRWESGSFHFNAQPVNPRRSGRQLPAEQILMDGLRMVDEWRTLDDDAKRETSVFRPVGRFQDFRAAPGQGSQAELAAAERVFACLDGQRSTRRVIDLARAGTFEGARALTALRAGGLAEPLSAEAQAQAARRRATPLASDWRSLALGAVPFLALFAVVVLIPSHVPPTQAALHGDGETRIEAALEARRARRLVEAYRFATGEGVSGLPELVEAGWLRPGELTHLYALQGPDGLLVLADE